MRIAESELIINGDGSVFHLHMRPEQLADNVILVGDPGRVDMIAGYLSDIECRNQSREFVSVTGKYNGKRVTALSTGIGTDNIDIVMTELDALANVDFATREPNAEHRRLTILRIGTTGALHADIPLGSYIFSHWSVGHDGLMNWYAGVDKLSDKDMEEAYMRHMGWSRRLTVPYFVKASQKLIDRFEDCTVKGMTIAAPGFYGPQGRVVRLGLVDPDYLKKIESFRYGDLRITNFEMEGSAIAGMAALLGHDAGTVCCAIANRYLQSANTDYQPNVRKLIELSLDRLTR